MWTIVFGLVLGFSVIMTIVYDDLALFPVLLLGSSIIFPMVAGVIKVLLTF